VEDECPKCPPEGLPAWMGTFADLMSLLMCFFVLLLDSAGGQIEISGHSDGVQISNELYRSNWDLSAQRAVAVAEELRLAEGFDESRMRVIGKASNELVDDGESAEARARNRRVEIAILQGKPKYSEPISITGSGVQ